MRPVTKKAVFVILAVVVVLLALGSLPGLLKSGDPYYLTAAPVDDVTVNGTNLTAAGGNITVAGATFTALDAGALPADRYPYVTGALADAGPDRTGRSEAYWKGFVGFKGAFTHSPFDEYDALAQRNPAATDGDAVYAYRNGTVYRLTVVQEGGG